MIAQIGVAVVGRWAERCLLAVQISCENLEHPVLACWIGYAPIITRVPSGSKDDDILPNSPLDGVADSRGHVPAAEGHGYDVALPPVYSVSNRL